MAWPTPQDYNEAVQTPHLSFNDPELQVGVPEATALGLPRPITGNFASVYRFHCGPRDWAVRCFWREVSDMQQRYRAISEHLCALGLPYTIEFEYQVQGIRIRGSWYPILKMAWQEGQLLNQYIETNLAQPAKLDALADEWIRMVGALEQSGIAHGDLQHGNILVTCDRLKLVDYDGMFVPALAGMGSHELGHQHYQHPLRTAASFDSRLDRFSALSIYVSLRSLAHEPALWSKSGAGEEHLLFTRQDYADPAASPIAIALHGLGDANIEALCNRFQAAMSAPLTDTPALTVAGTKHAPNDSVPSARPPLILKHFTARWNMLVPPVTVPVDGVQQELKAVHPEWLTGYLPMPRAADPTPSVNHVQVIRFVSGAVAPLAATCALPLLAIGASLYVAIFAALTAFAMTVFLVNVFAYRREPIVRPAIASARRRAELHHSAREVRRRKKHIETALVRSSESDRADVLALQDRRARATARTEKERQRRLTVKAGKLQALDHRLAKLREDESNALKELQEAQQQRHLASELRRTLLWTANLSGVTRQDKIRFTLMGVWSASDVTASRIRAIHGIPEPIVRRLVEWRIATLADAARTQPMRACDPAADRAARKYGKRYRRITIQRQEVELSCSKFVFASTDADLAAAEAEISSVMAKREESRTEMRCSLRLVNELAADRAAKLHLIDPEESIPTALRFSSYVRMVYLSRTGATGQRRQSPID